MELNRNHFFLLGLILLLFGIQLRLVYSFLLTPESAKFVVERIERKKPIERSQPFAALMTITTPIQRKTIEPPRWLGWALISAGAVLILNSLAMQRPE